MWLPCGMNCRRRLWTLQVLTVSRRIWTSCGKTILWNMIMKNVFLISDNKFRFYDILDLSSRSVWILICFCKSHLILLWFGFWIEIILTCLMWCYTDLFCFLLHFNLSIVNLKFYSCFINFLRCTAFTLLIFLFVPA